MESDPLHDEVLSRVGMSRRDVVRRLIAGTAFAFPVIASFDMASLTTSVADAHAVYGSIDIMTLSPTHGPEAGGNSVTITFSNQLGDAITEVDFGAAPAAIVSSTAFDVVVTAPPGTGTVVVTVTFSEGGTLFDLAASPADMYTYDPPVVATTLRAKPLLRTGFQPTAVLTRSDTRAALGGETIAFAVAGHQIGTGVTNAQGVATLRRFVASLNGFTASFAGTAAFGASSAHGDLL